MNQTISIPNIKVMKRIYHEFKDENIGFLLFLRVTDQKDFTSNIGLDYFGKLEPMEKRMEPMFQKKMYPNEIVNIEIMKEFYDDIKN
jgi:hypothetical protein